MSVDNKAKVPIGVAAVTKQAPLIMHVSYEIQLPDHDFVKATKHKLTSSLYAACEIKPPFSRADPEITYSGPTYIAVRSRKHDSSTAYTHGRDFDYLLGLKEFDKVVKHKNAVKPIGMFFVMEVEMKTQDSQKHWTLAYSILRTTIWIRY